MASKPLFFPPGSRNQYCNGCYIVLGEIIARVSGIVVVVGNLNPPSASRIGAAVKGKLR